MNPLKHPYDSAGDAILLGNHAIYDVNQIHGLDELPAGLDNQRLLTLELPSIDARRGDDHAFRREFYLCYWYQQRFLFVVETEVKQWTRRYFEPQYGRNDNYDTCTVRERIVWIYKPDSPRAKDPAIANHLKEYVHTQIRFGV